MVCPVRGFELEALGASGSTPVAAADVDRQLRLWATVMAIGYAANFVQWQVLPWIQGTWWAPEHAVRGLAMILLCLLLRVTARKERCGLRLALLVQLIAVAEVGIPGPSVLSHSAAALQEPFGILWNCVLICVFPLMVPAAPTIHALVALLGASALPLWTWLAQHQGWQHLSWEATWAFTIPAYICGGLAAVVARLNWRVRRALVEARTELARLGSYQLERRIGAGGMGEVWLARHALLRRPAAVKLIHSSRLGLGAEEAIARFEREAQALAALCSRHTVAIHDFGRNEDGAFFIVMELLDGCDCAELLERHGPQAPERVAHILRQVCLSLGEAHAANLVHRDIKPANLRLCTEGLELDVVKVLDFGLVTPVEHGGDSRLTDARTVHGTPAYMAPEQALGTPIDGRADLYALGCVAMELLTGRPPFDEDTPARTMISHVRKDPPALPEAVPEALRRLVNSLLAKDPDDRPASAAAVLAFIDAEGLALPWTQERAAAWWQTHGNTCAVPGSVPLDAPPAQVTARALQAQPA